MPARSPSLVAILGSINTDITAFSERLPKPGETILGRRVTIALGGKGANQAVAVARLGARAVFIGRTGTDAFGAQVRGHLAEYGVDTEHLGSDAKAPTGVAIIDVDERGENCIVVVPGTNHLIDASDVARADGVLKSAGALLLQLETPLAPSLAAAQIVRAAGGMVLLDPAPVPPAGLGDEALRAADFVTPNEVETERLVGVRPDTEVKARTAAARLIERGARAAIVKMGAAGVYFRDAKEQGFVPAFPVNSVNTVGAGDSFNGGLAVALARGDDLPRAVRFAAACGALATTGSGGAGSAPSLAAVEGLLARAHAG